MSQQPTITKMMTFIKSVIMSDPPVLSNVQKSMFGAGVAGADAAQPQDSTGQPQDTHNRPVDNSVASKMWGGLKTVGASVGAAAQTGYQYGQEKYAEHKKNKDAAAVASDTDGLKSQAIDKIDGAAQDIVFKSENSLRSLIDLKTKMENDKIIAEDQSAGIKDQLMIIESNIGILEKKCSGIQANSNKTTWTPESLTVDNIDQIVTVDDPFSEKIIKIVAKKDALEDCMAAVKKGFEKDAISLQDFLKQIRQLSMKQCKQINKMQKINAALNPN